MSRIKRAREWLGMRVTPLLLWVVAQLLCRTVRLKVVGEEHLNPDGSERGRLLVVWHSLALLPVFYLRRRKYRALISLSRDGEYQSRVFSLFGWRPLRGSTRRGAVRCLKEALRGLKGGQTLGLTPDGPLGPPGACQPGCVYLARASGAAIIPMGVAFSRAARLSTWDRFRLPLPFSRACVEFGEPIVVAGVMDNREIEELQQMVGQAIDRCVTRAEAHVLGGGNASRRSGPDGLSKPDE